MSDSLAPPLDAHALEMPAAPVAAPAAPRRAAWWAAGFHATTQKAVVAMFDQAVVSGTTFATSVIVGHMGSRDTLGVFYLAWTIVVLVQAIQERTISTPYMIYCSRRSGGALAFYTGSALLHQVGLSALVGAGLLAFLVASACGAGPADFTPFAAALLGAMPFLLLRWFVRLVSIAHLQMSTTAALDTVVAVLQLSGLLLLARWHLLSVPAAYLVMGAACAVACLGWFLTRQQPLRFARAHVLADWRHNWAFGKWVLASNLVGSTAGCVVPWVITAAHGKSATGLLAACATMAGISNMFVASLDGFITSKAAQAFSTGGVARLLRILWTAALLFCAVLGTFCLLLVAIGGPLVRFVYGADFSGAGPVVVVLAVGILVNAIGNNAGRGLWVIERPRANMLPDICSLLVTFVVLFCVLPWGPLGAAIATLAGNAAGCITRSWVLAAALKTIPHRLEAA